MADLFMSKAAAERDNDGEFCMALFEHAYVNPAQALELVPDMPMVDSEKRRLRATIRRWVKTLREAGHSHKACFGVTEPNKGLNTLKLKTFAKRVGDRHVVNGQIVWSSTAQVAREIMLLARTSPIEVVTAQTQDLSLFNGRARNPPSGREPAGTCRRR